MANGYQRRKAKQIVAYLLGLNTSLTRFQLVKAVSLMSFSDWRTVAFAAGVAVADIPAKLAVLNILRQSNIHVA